MSSGVTIYEVKSNGKDFIFKDFNKAAEKMDKIKKEDVYRQKLSGSISRWQRIWDY